ncbi:MAG: hypothetical protein JKX96_04310 [Acinetobacter sp.]|nr:hypothetical protein [Acinetobacter sp.]
MMDANKVANLVAADWGLEVTTEQLKQLCSRIIEEIQTNGVVTGDVAGTCPPTGGPLAAGKLIAGKVG